jgi:hypothetical protein
MASESKDVGRDERRVTRRGVLAGGLAGAGGLAAGGIAPDLAGAAALHRVGEPRDGTAAAEVVGHLDQVGDAITGYGYLTRIHGLRRADLFRGPDATEATARFTFFSNVQVNARFIRGTLVSVDGVGTLTFFLDSGGADFANPATFSDGTAIARFAAHFHNLLTVVAPNQGVSTIAGELTQRQARMFSFEGRRAQFGHRGLRLHLSVAGPSTRTAPSPPTAFFEVAGDITVVP